jgi:transcription termination factor Rho
MTDYQDYTRKELEAKNIPALRVFARNIKVESLTGMSKEKLIDACLTKLDAMRKGIAQEPTKVGKKRGRPPKDTMTFDDKGVDSNIIRAALEQNDEILKGLTTSVENAFEPTPSPEPVTCPPSSNAQPQFEPKKRPIEQNNNRNFPRRDVKKREEDSCDEQSQGPVEVNEGVLEIMPDGYGFLRAKNYDSGDNDSYVSAQKIKRSGLKKGDWIKAETRKTCENRPAGVVNILEVNGRSPEFAFNRKNFDTLTPIYPDERYRLEINDSNNDFAIRAIDIVAPIGKGQRAMIVSPPKAGKTTILKKIANAITANYPESHLIVLLVDERPEEVTDMQRSISGEVVYSTFDEMPEHHTKASELVLERAKRLVELGEDVVILMDSLTRLARAYNLTIAPTGRTLSGGIDPGALHNPKRFFGAARNIEFGGSLTIIATALVDTGSKMDDVIYEEFKGTGNMELHLDRKLQEKRIFPAIDLNRSGTRREELLLDQSELQGMWIMRKMLSTGDNNEATENLINCIIKTKTNKDFFNMLEAYMAKLVRLKQQGHTLK